MYRILIGDDHPEWLQFSRQVLESRGYTVVTASTMDAVHHLLEQNGHDLILINADFLFGKIQESLDEFFRNNKEKPIIIVSVPSSTHKALQESRIAFKMGATDYVDKPFNSEQLLALVEHLLSQFVDKAQPYHQGAMS